MTREQNPIPDVGPDDPESEDVDTLVDEWGEDSFPASDPPGTLPPSLREEEKGDTQPN